MELSHNEEMGIEYPINLISIFLKESLKREKVELLVRESIDLLNEVQRDEQSIDKLVSMITNKKGQRTVSKEYLNFTKLLEEKRFDKVTIKYN